MSLESITIDLLMERAGWASIDFHLGDRSYRMNGVSHIYDPMNDLMRAGAMIAKRPSETSVRFFGEPMEWRLWLSPTDHDDSGVAIEIGTFPDFAQKLGEHSGVTVLSGVCNRKRFARTLLNAFWPWSEKQAEYQKLWYEPFPAEGFAMLKASVAS